MNAAVESAKYGLPLQVKFCKRCVISNQRPSSAVEYAHTAQSRKETIHFDSEGICDACRVAERKASIDWDSREEDLRELLAEHRSKDGSYDCIVPGSGGKDSFYAAHVLKSVYGMHPLLVTWAPHMATEWGRRNLERWQEIADHILVTPNRSVHRLLTRLAVENLFHPFQPFIVGQKTVAAKLAVKHGIDLIFYGESEAEYGDPKSKADKSQRHSAYHARSGDIFLSGVAEEELRGSYGLTTADLEQYMPLRETEEVDVRYLGYYLKWHPQSCYYYAVENGGFEASPERTPGTYSKYNSIDDKLDDFHYFTTWIKFGIGRATYDAAQEIRSGEITREEGVALVRRFDGEWPHRFSHETNEYLSVPGFEPMTDDRWHELARKFRSPHLWDGDRLRYVVT
jgi:N-acetyl sugar amidotransferase